VSRTVPIGVPCGTSDVELDVAVVLGVLDEFDPLQAASTRMPTTPSRPIDRRAGSLISCATERGSYARSGSGSSPDRRVQRASRVDDPARGDRDGQSQPDRARVNRSSNLT
jgi:hypothetical protein